MQPNIKNDLLYLLRILEACKKIRLYTYTFNTSNEFYASNSQLEVNATLNQLAQIGEQAKKLSTTLLDKYIKISWNKIKGFRNIIVHEYSGIDIENVFTIIQEDIPKLYSDIISIITEELTIGNFDYEEFEIAKSSPYLKHIDFSDF
jgi:uncharacterized protein with HEPN domain